MMFMLARSGVVVACLLLAVGCAQHTTSDTGRTAVEQLLLSTAADQAVSELGLSLLKDRQVYVDATHFESVDKAYAIDRIRDAIGVAGGLLVSDRAEADTVVDIRSGALGTERNEFLIGIPAIPVPIPMAGVVTSPELPLYKQNTQQGIAKFALHATNVEDGRQLFSSGPVSGKAYHTRRVILFVPLRSTDVPELQN